MSAFIPWLPETLTTTFQWRTDVLRATDGTERRIALWFHPMVTIDVTYKLQGEERGDLEVESIRRDLRAMLFADHDVSYEVPFRHYALYLEDDVALAGDVLVVNRARSYDWLTVGRKVYVEVDENEDGYVATVESLAVVGDNFEVTLDTGAPTALEGANTRICPVFTIQPSDGQTLGSFRGSEAGSWTFTGTLQTFYMFNQGEFITPVEFDDLVVWDRPCLQDTEELGEEFEAGLRIVGAPLLFVDTQYAAAMIRRDQMFQIDGVDELRWYLKVIMALYGQQVPFLRSTHREDLRLAVQPASPTNTLLVHDDPDYSPWHAHDSHKRLALGLSDGSTAYVRVTTLFDNADGTYTLTLSAPFSRGALTIERVSFLEVTRLAQDNVVVTHSRVGNRLTLAAQFLTGPWVDVPPMV